MTPGLTAARKKVLKAIAAYGPVNGLRIWALRTAGYRVGRDVYLGEQLHVTDELTDTGTPGVCIGDRASIAQRVTIIVSSHPNEPELRAIVGTRIGAVEIGEDAWIGAAAILLPGVIVGHHAVVGAGAVVTRAVSPWTVVAGNPARLIRRLRD